MSSDPNANPPDAAVTTEGEAFVTPAERLRYIEQQPPKVGEAVSLVPGLQWLRIPLPIDLNHINVWLLDHDEGYVLVDTGMPMDECKAAWEQLEKSVLARKPLRAIIVTHFHTDHMGLASWLQERHQVPLWASRGTQTMVERMLEVMTDEKMLEAERFFIAHGVTEIDKFRPLIGGTRALRSFMAPPRFDRYLHDEEVLELTSARWRALEVHGHADAHICLNNDEQHVLISGDQILPRISSNIALMFRTIHPDPLRAYFESLERLSLLPKDTLVLPSHGQPFRALQVRAADLAQHHRDELDIVLTACREPRTVQEVVSAMYKRPLHGLHRMLAFAEAFAHVEHLKRAGRLRQRLDNDGVYRYTA